MKRHLLRDLARHAGSRRRLHYAIAVLRKMGGVHRRRCNLCGYEGRFDAAGHPPRYDAECLGCGARERQRLFGLLLERRPELVRGRVVHFAPEPELAPRLRAGAEHYLTADLLMPGCDLRADLAALGLADSSVDLFVANHVLEHVPDDARALRELYRCLVRGGAALLSVPQADGWTEAYHDPAIAFAGTDELRDRHFGRLDHVRFYGADFPARVEAAGFELETFTAGGAETAAHALLPGDRIFIARKA